MKRSRLITSIFALTLFVSAVPIAHADTFNVPSVPDPNQQLQQAADQAAADIHAGVGTDPNAPTLSPFVTPTAPSVPVPGAITNNNPNDPNSTFNVAPSTQNTNGSPITAAAGTPTSLSSPTGPSLFTDPLDYIMVKLMSLFAWLLGIAAITLDNAMYYTVVHMGDYIHGLSAVGVAWRILRDIGNIILIFGFLALGITVILDVNWYGGGTKMLPVLLISAIFLNFSLFAAEAVIDVGNLFATQFYTQINGGAAAKPLTWSTENVHNEGISNAVMNQLGLQGFYNNAAADSKSENVNAIFQTGHPFILGFMALLVFLVAAFVFFSLAFILIARFIFLIFLIIVAPIGIAGMAVPKLEGLASDWWSNLFAQTMTAPAMLLMLYVALAVITDAQFLTGFGVGGGGSTGSSNVAQNAWIAAVTNSTGTNVGALAGVLLSFLVAMGLLLAVTMLAKKMCAKGGEWAVKMGGRASFGLAALGASTAIGGSARLMRAGVQSYAPKSKLGQAVSRGATRSLRFVENRKFDTRSVPGVGAALSAAGAGAAATPVAKSALERGKQLNTWWQGKEEIKKYDEETRIPRLKRAVDPARPQPAEASKIMRSLTDDEFKSGEIQQLISTNVGAIKALTNPQAASLPDKTIMTPLVYQNLTPQKLEAIRSAGNMADANAKLLGPLLLAHNAAFNTFFGARTGNQQQDMRDFWGI